MNKIKKSSDGTLERNSIETWKKLIEEYELIKVGKSTRFKFVQEFYNYHKIKRQNFIKYYNRFKATEYKDESLLLPQIRGPKYMARKTKFPEKIENLIVDFRNNYGFNRFEIRSELLDNGFNIEELPSYSTIYNILQRHNLNKKTPKMKEAKQAIIKTRAGEMGHIDCHYLPKNIIKNDENRYFLVGLIDDFSRVVFVKAIRTLTALEVMFATLEMLTNFRLKYGIVFKDMLSDNGSEFGSGPKTKNKDNHPFEVMLSKMSIKHRYTKPYRPQTNGKIERFWKIIEDDLIDGMLFGSFEHLEEELLKYSLYFNELREHSSLGHKTPAKFLEENK